MVRKKLLHCTEIICCSDRFVVVGVGRSLFISVYLPCVGSTNRMCVIEEILCELNDYICKYNDRHIIIGGDFNTDLDKVNLASDIINKFAATNNLHRRGKLSTSDGMCRSDTQCTYYDDSRGVQSALDFFFTNDSGTVLSFELLDRVMNL